MEINLAENYIVLTNVLYLFSLPIAIRKKVTPAIFGILGIFVFSSEYHICYAPVQILSNVNYNYQNLCIIDNIAVYGIITMFFDMFFATFNAYIIFVYLLMVKRGLVFRYTIMAIGLLLFVIIGCFVGFIPDPSRRFDNVFMMAKYVTAHSYNHTGQIDGRVESMMNTLAKTERSNFLTGFSLLYTGIISLYFMFFTFYAKFMFTYKKRDFNKNISMIRYSFIIMRRFYQKRFNLLFLIPSIAIGLFGLFVWIFMEGFLGYYLSTHGFWHICTAFSLFLFLYSIRPEGFRFPNKIKCKNKIKIKCGINKK